MSLSQSEWTIFHESIKLYIIDNIKWKNQSKYWKYWEAVSMFICLGFIVVIWLKYCRYGVKHYPINQSINQCMGCIISLENFSLIWRRHRVTNFDLRSALMAIEQWRFFSYSVSHVPWHRASVYNGNLRWPVTITAIAERLVEELSLPVFTCTT